MHVQAARLRPASVAPHHGPLAVLAGLDAPFDARLTLETSGDGQVRAADLQVTGGEGVLYAGGRRASLQQARIDARLDASTGIVSIHEARLVSEPAVLDISGEFSGFAGFKGALPTRAQYTLDIGAGHVNPGDMFPTALTWRGGSLSGTLDVEARMVRFETLEALLPKANIGLTGEISMEQTRAGWLPNFQLRGSVSGELNRDDVLGYWPVSFAVGARDWIQNNIPDGTVHNAQLEMDIRAPALAQKTIEDSALSLRFGFRDVDVRYAATMTPLAGLSGEAELRGDSFSLEGVGGAIDAIRMETVFVNMPRFHPGGGMARLGGVGRGDARQFLELISLAPLNLAPNYNFNNRTGAPTQTWINGEVGVQAQILGSRLAFTDIEAKLDFEDAAIALPGALWSKSAGEPAQAQLRVGLDDNGDLHLKALHFEARGAALKASARLTTDGRLLEAQADRIFIEDRMDFGVQAMRPHGLDSRLQVTADGAFLDVRDVLGRLAPPGGAALNADLDFSGNLGRVLVRGQLFSDVSLALNARPEGVARFILDADSAAGPLSVRFEPEAETGIRQLSASGTDAGILLSAFTGFDNLAGGVVEIHGSAPPLGEPGGVNGSLRMQDFVLEKMPVLVQIAAASSLEGLGSLFSGQGIGFDRLETEFVWEDGVLDIRQARVAGPSLGAAWSGIANFAEAQLDMDGTLLHSYGMSSVLASAPLVGELLTSRRGEGVIGMTFSVSGPFDQTRVVANPLSVLAPGVFRRLFEGPSARRAPDAPDADRRARDE